MMKESLKEFVKSSDLVSMKDTSHDGVFLLKYKKKVFWDNLWNEYLEECRGTLVDKDFNVISRPFTKIYNYMIDERSPVFDPDTPVTAYRKVNGFMVAVTAYDHCADGMIISTTGTTDSQYVEYARSFMDYPEFKREIRKYAGYTFLFECVHPDDPHIIPEFKGLYLLGMRENSWESRVQPHMLSRLADRMQVYHEKGIYTTVGKLIKKTAEVHHEGFVFYTHGENVQSAKIKSPFYLTSKFLARCNNTKKLVDPNIKRGFDEEYYPLFDKISEYSDEFLAMSEQERLRWIRQFLYIMDKRK